MVEAEADSCLPLLTCAHCGVTSPSVKRCTGCHSVGFCSVEHQRKHWKIHKKVCRKSMPFYLQPSSPKPFETKCLIASQDIPKGSIIHEERPIFQYGNDYTMLKELINCVTCGDLIRCNKEECGQKHDEHSCSRCGWPACSVECQNMKIHSENECKVFCASDMTRVEKNGTNLLLARAFAMRSQKPETWDEILRLCPQYHKELKNLWDPQLYENIEREGKSTSRMISKFPKLHFFQEKMVAAEIIQQMLAISKRVGFQVGPTGTIVPYSFGTFLYKIGSNFTSSCAPNCMWTVGPCPDFKLRIRAAVDIKLGQVLTVIRHCGHYFGAAHKLTSFISSYNRPCFCDLCTDPTEFGTYQSAIACSKCKTRKEKGYLLPPPPLPFSGENACNVEGAWTCSNPKCRDQINGSAFSLKVQTMFHSLTHDKAATATTIVEEECGTFLHENHWLVQQATLHYKHPAALTFPALPDIPYNLGEEGELEFMEKTVVGFEKTLGYYSKIVPILNKTLPGLQHERLKFLQKVSVATMNLTAFYARTPESLCALSRSKVTDLKDKLQIARSFCQDIKLFWKYSFLPRGPNGVAFLLKECDHRVEQVSALCQVYEKQLKTFDKIVTDVKSINEISPNSETVPKIKDQEQELELELELSPTLKLQINQENQKSEKTNVHQKSTENSEEKAESISLNPEQAPKETSDSLKPENAQIEAETQTESDAELEPESETQETSVNFSDTERNSQDLIPIEPEIPDANPEENSDVDSKNMEESNEKTTLQQTISKTEESEISIDVNVKNVETSQAEEIEPNSTEEVQLENSSITTSKIEFHEENTFDNEQEPFEIKNSIEIPETTEKSVQVEVEAELEIATEIVAEESVIKSEVIEESSNEKCISESEANPAQIQIQEEGNFKELEESLTINQSENARGTEAKSDVEAQSSDTEKAHSKVSSNLVIMEEVVRQLEEEQEEEEKYSEPGSEKLNDQSNSNVLKIEEIENPAENLEPGSEKLNDQSNSNVLKIEEIENPAENLKPDQNFLLISEPEEKPEEISTEKKDSQFTPVDKIDEPSRFFSVYSQFNNNAQKFIIRSEMLAFIQFYLKKGMEKSELVKICSSFYSISEIQKEAKLLTTILSTTSQTSTSNFTLENSLKGTLETEEEAELTLQGVVICLAALNENDNSGFEFGASDLDNIPLVPAPASLSPSFGLRSMSTATSKFPRSLDLLKNCEAVSPSHSEAHSVDAELELDRVSVASQNSSFSSSSSKKTLTGPNFVVGVGPPLFPLSSSPTPTKMKNQISKPQPPKIPTPLQIEPDREPEPEHSLDVESDLDLNSMKNSQPKWKPRHWDLFITGYPISYESSKIHHHLQNKGLSNIFVVKLPSKPRKNNGNDKGKNLPHSSFQIRFDPPNSKRLCAEVYNPTFWPRGCRLVRRWHEPKNTSDSKSTSIPKPWSENGQHQSSALRATGDLTDEKIQQAVRDFCHIQIQKCRDTIFTRCSIL